MNVTRRLALGGVLGLTVAARAGAQNASTRVSLRIASTPNDDVTPALYAQEQDLFRKAGLDVTLTPMQSGSAISAAVAGGAVDIGRSSMLPLISARAKGIPFVLVAPGGMYLAAAPPSAVVVPASSAVRTAKDLEGKIVSSPALGDLDSVALRNWIDANGGDSTKVQYVEMPGSAVSAELAAGRVAAGMLQNPFLAQAVKSGAVRVLGYHLSSIAPRLMQSAWFSTEPYLQKNPVAVREFASVLQTSSAFCNAHPAQTVNVLAAFTKLEPATIAAMPRTQFATALDPALIQPMIDVAAKYHVIDRAYDARDLFPRSR